MIASDPVSGAVLVTDLGSDAVMIYTLDDTGRLRPRGDTRLAAAPGAGSRHLPFHPDGLHLFVVNELVNTVCVLRREGDRFTRVHQPRDCAEACPAGSASARPGTPSRCTTVERRTPPPGSLRTARTRGSAPSDLPRHGLRDRQCMDDRVHPDSCFRLVARCHAALGEGGAPLMSAVLMARLSCSVKPPQMP